MRSYGHWVNLDEQLREIQELTDLLSFELKKVPNIHMLLLDVGGMKLKFG